MQTPEDLDSFLKSFSEQLKKDGNYRAEEGECPEFAIALARFLGVSKPVFNVGIRTMTPYEWDADALEYIEDSYMQETCLSHVVLEVDGNEYDWTGTDATARWESAFEDSDTEKHTFEWYPADYSKLAHYINLQRRVAFESDCSTLNVANIEYWQSQLESHAKALHFDNHLDIEDLGFNH